MPEHWSEHAERSNPLMLRLIAAIARYLGRPVARLLLWPIVAYYLCTAPAARRASREYLQRVLDRPVRWRDLFRHFHTFAAVTLDRVFLFLGDHSRLDIRVHGEDAVRGLTDGGRGSLMLVSHVGSFDVMRATAERSNEPTPPIRILMARRHGAMMQRVLESLNPEFARSIIDTSERDVDLILRLRDSVDAGQMIGIMADRLHVPDERSAPVCMFGARTRLPASPWIMAALLKVPVLQCVGLYRGGNRYDLYIETLAERVDAPRGRRDEAVAAYAQAYASRLEHFARQAPYNWFNFYAFWDRDTAGDNAE